MLERRFHRMVLIALAIAVATFLAGCSHKKSIPTVTFKNDLQQVAKLQRCSDSTCTIFNYRAQVQPQAFAPVPYAPGKPAIWRVFVRPGEGVAGGSFATITLKLQGCITVDLPGPDNYSPPPPILLSTAKLCPQDLAAASAQPTSPSPT